MARNVAKYDSPGLLDARRMMYATNPTEKSTLFVNVNFDARLLTSEAHKL